MTLRVRELTTDERRKIERLVRASPRRRGIGAVIPTRRARRRRPRCTRAA
jgi:hypothetical protein